MAKKKKVVKTKKKKKKVGNSKGKSLEEAIIDVFKWAHKSNVLLEVSHVVRIIQKEYSNFLPYERDIKKAIKNLVEKGVIKQLKKGSKYYTIASTKKKRSYIDDDFIDNIVFQQMEDKGRISKIFHQKLKEAKKGYRGNIAEKPSADRYKSRTAAIFFGFEDKETGKTIYTPEEVKKYYRLSNGLPNFDFINSLLKKGFDYNEINRVCNYPKYDWYYILGVITKDDWLRGSLPSDKTKVDNANRIISKIFSYSKARSSEEIKKVVKSDEFKKALYSKYKKYYRLQGYLPKDAHKLAYKKVKDFLDKHFLESSDESLTLPSIKVMLKNTEEERKKYNSDFHWQFRRKFYLMDSIRVFLPDEVVRVLKQNKDMSEEQEKIAVQNAIEEFKSYSVDFNKIEKVYPYYLELFKKDKKNPYVSLLKNLFNKHDIDYKKKKNASLFVSSIIFTIDKISHSFASDTFARFNKTIMVPLGEYFDVHDPRFKVTELVKKNPFDFRIDAQKVDVAVEVIKEWERHGRLPKIEYTKRGSNYPYMMVENSVVFDAGYHIWFAPAGREKVFDFQGKSKDDYIKFKKDILSYLRSWALQHNVIIKDIGIGADHVHLNLQVPPSVVLKKFVEQLKIRMTTFLRNEYPEFYQKKFPLLKSDVNSKTGLVKYETGLRFWQHGFGVRSFSQLDAFQVSKYVDEQMKKEYKALGFSEEDGFKEEDDEIKKRKEYAKFVRDNMARELAEKQYRDAFLSRNITSERDKLLLGLHNNPRVFVYSHEFDGGESFAMKVFENDNYCCHICGDSNIFGANGRRNLQIDHIIPMWLWKRMDNGERSTFGLLGSPHKLHNLQLLCLKCHTAKSRLEQKFLKNNQQSNSELAELFLSIHKNKKIPLP